MHAVGQLHSVGGPAVQAQMASLSGVLAEKYGKVHGQIMDAKKKEKK